jgi:hypothetical protein
MVGFDVDTGKTDGFNFIVGIVLGGFDEIGAVVGWFLMIDGEIVGRFNVGAIDSFVVGYLSVGLCDGTRDKTTLWVGSAVGYLLLNSAVGFNEGVLVMETSVGTKFWQQFLAKFKVVYIWLSIQF